MDHIPNYTEDVSMRLSEVLSDIGVNERIVLKRRRAMQLHESLDNMFFKNFMKYYTKTPLFKIVKVLCRSLMIQVDLKPVNYLMGSQCEGTTTLGLQSDTDILTSLNNAINIIQDWSDWKPGVINWLMVQDEDVSPGYCKLQVLRTDAPLPLLSNPGGVAPLIASIDRTGRIFVKNNFSKIVFSKIVSYLLKYIIPNGPAMTNGETDFVLAYPCATWPLQARQWFDQQGVGQWPSEELKQYCYSTGCLVVPVGRAGSENEEIEWRVSTSFAERCLMFNLNITQIRCYVLMKMIKKTFIDPLFKDVITSFMCKTVLLHCIENNQSSIWRENNLLVCLTVCLRSLYNNVHYANCPHFFIPGNNLMRGKIPPLTKPYILEILQHIINTEGSDLLGIKCDNLGLRIQMKFNNLCPSGTCKIISGDLLSGIFAHFYHFVDLSTRDICNTDEPIKELKQYISNILNDDEIEKTVRNLVTSRLGALLGSALASIAIQQNNCVSAEALSWISTCLNTDVASSKLKLASILYCTRQYQKSEFVLSNIEENYDVNIVEPVCRCYERNVQARRPGFNAACDQHDEEAIKIVVANCVSFIPIEVNCVPNELKQEMFRSTNEDRAYRRATDEWMDSAVVDSLTFLYYLQYKIYHNLGRRRQKQKALANLARTIECEPNLCHRETALNLLGQCMEQENKPRQALYCYKLSLNVRWRNNAAKIHICRLLNKMYHNNQ